MTRRDSKPVPLVAALVIVVAAAGWIFAPSSATQALTEALRPKTVKMMSPPDDCIQTSETPPASLMRTLQLQKGFYQLELQKVVACRIDRKMPEGQRSIASEFLEKDRGTHWLPLYVGCCSYQFRRHVVVLAVNEDEKGTLVLEAALIQDRWAYLRANWATDRTYWN